MEWVDYPLFAYEKALGAREVENLSQFVGSTGTPIQEALRSRATFLRAVPTDGGDPRPTVQSEVEDKHRELRGRVSKRQSTRFLVHGLHEYKGKFNPQMARSLVNVVDPTATALLDPFCGSGTSLVEGLRLGLSVGGIDRNPLAAWMAEVKVRALRRSGDPSLARRFRAVTSEVATQMARAQTSGVARTPVSVDEADDAYLRQWFSEEVLAALWLALDTAAQEPDDVCADVLRLTVSNMVRAVSWQLPEDLRVRRRPQGWTPPDVSEVFSRLASANTLALEEVGVAEPIESRLRSSVLLGSSQDRALVRTAAPEGRRLVVTSPPYATALPYIDTDRLSLVLLGLAKSGDIRMLERELTGSREWTVTIQREWDRARVDNRDDLPPAVTDLVARISDVNHRQGAGFRRAAVPSLLYRYFSDMGRTLDALGSVLRAGEKVVLVVGSNRTGKGPDAITIPTPELIGEVGASRDYVLQEVIPLETWPRYGMHASNAVNEERAVVLVRR